MARALTPARRKWAEDQARRRRNEGDQSSFDSLVLFFAFEDADNGPDFGIQGEDELHDSGNEPQDGDAGDPGNAPDYQPPQPQNADAQVDPDTGVGDSGTDASGDTGIDTSIDTSSGGSDFGGGGDSGGGGFDGGGGGDAGGGGF